jgi:ornithine carbamoyltransferase
MVRHLRHDRDLSAADVARVLDLAADVKRNKDKYRTKLAGKSVAVIFSKQSTRTRVSFEVGCYELGAHPLILTAGGSSGMQMGRGEPIFDTAKVMSRFVDAIVIRTFLQADVDGLAEHGSVPVVNALTDDWHPCQVLADMLTLREHFGRDLHGKKLVYVGAGNNMTHSLAAICPRVGMDFVACCPKDLGPTAELWAQVQQDAAFYGTKMTWEPDPKQALAGAHCVYTDTWVSMGQDAEADALRKKMAGYTIDHAMMKYADPKAVFLHCLPAHRGEEVLPEVIDGPQSLIYDEAENRLHAQKAVLLLLMGGEQW